MGSSLDSILLQKRGAAGFAVLTTPFGEQVNRAMAYERSDRPLPAIVLDHPMQNVSPDELKARATALADIAEGILNGEWDTPE